MGAMMLGKIPNEVLVSRHSDPTEGLSPSADGATMSIIASYFGTVSRLWPLASIETVTAWSS